MQEEPTLNQIIKQNHKQQSVALCLNPECPSFSRSFTYTGDYFSQKKSELHRQCGKWCLSLQQLREKAQISFSVERTELMDFLTDPIRSLFEVNALLRCKWRDQITAIFNSIKDDINKAINKVLQESLFKFENNLNFITTLCENINKMEKWLRDKEWTIKESRYYRQNMEKGMREINSIGMLKVLNFQGVAFNLERIKNQIQQLSNNIWQKQSPFSLKERCINLESQIELQTWVRQQNPSDINLKLQKLSSHLKLKPIQLQQENDSFIIRCPKCNKKISNKQGNKQTKKANCQKMLLQHFCQAHTKEVIEKCLNKGKIKHHLQYRQFQIQLQTYNEFLVIDRENINSENVITCLKPQVYRLEIVSKSRQNLASGRYLVAESTGKDAADTLIIIVLYQIGRINPQAKITLLTKDHFGETLLSILRSLGRQISIDSSYDGKNRKKCE